LLISLIWFFLRRIFDYWNRFNYSVLYYLYFILFTMQHDCFMSLFIRINVFFHLLRKANTLSSTNYSFSFLNFLIRFYFNFFNLLISYLLFYVLKKKKKLMSKLFRDESFNCDGLFALTINYRINWFNRWQVACFLFLFACYFFEIESIYKKNMCLLYKDWARKPKEKQLKSNKKKATKSTTLLFILLLVIFPINTNFICSEKK